MLRPIGPFAARQAPPAFCGALAPHQANLLSPVVRSLCSKFDETVFAIALRGSITRNTAMVRSSDIDLFLLMYKSVKLMDSYDLPLHKASSSMLAKPLISVFWPTPNGRGGVFRLGTLWTRLYQIAACTTPD